MAGLVVVMVVLVLVLLLLLLVVVVVVVVVVAVVVVVIVVLGDRLKVSQELIEYSKQFDSNSNNCIKLIFSIVVFFLFWLFFIGTGSQDREPHAFPIALKSI